MTKSYIDDDQTWVLIFEDTYTKARYTTLEKGNYMQAVLRAKPRIADQVDIPESRLGLINQAQEGEVIETIVASPRIESRLVKANDH